MKASCLYPRAYEDSSNIAIEHSNRRGDDLASLAKRQRCMPQSDTSAILGPHNGRADANNAPNTYQTLGGIELRLTTVVCRQQKLSWPDHSACRFVNARRYALTDMNTDRGTLYVYETSHRVQPMRTSVSSATSTKAF